MEEEPVAGDAGDETYGAGSREECRCCCIARGELGNGARSAVGRHGAAGKEKSIHTLRYVTPLRIGKKAHSTSVSRGRASSG